MFNTVKPGGTLYRPAIFWGILGDPGDYNNLRISREFYGLCILRGGNLSPSLHHSTSGRSPALPAFSPSPSRHREIYTIFAVIDAGIFLSNIFAWIRVTRTASTDPSPSEDRLSACPRPLSPPLFAEGCIVFETPSPGSSHPPNFQGPDFSPDAPKWSHAARCPDFAPIQLQAHPHHRVPGSQCSTESECTNVYINVQICTSGI